MPKSKLRGKMSVGNKHQPNRVYIPLKIFKHFGLEYGDYFDTETVGKKIVLNPVKVEKEAQE
ncbi:hypothetical protein [Halobacillus ihumii]|uniref:hypothetical protein n=1 Tax=Halobacillus ihumii TaxID=2686092 RepID=UPI0013D88FE7|nr:hypothetical protein [Halobacillus ihumii]